jgi:hypothetical protein
VSSGWRDPGGHATARLRAVLDEVTALPTADAELRNPRRVVEPEH